MVTLSRYSQTRALTVKMIWNKHVMEDKPSHSICARKRGRKWNEEFITSNSIRQIDATILFLSPTTSVTTTPNDKLFLPRSIKQQKPHTPIMIGYSCLLIPAAFLVWWYWTKRTARRVVRKVITFSHGETTSSSDDMCNCAHDDDPTSPNYYSYTSTSPQSEPYHYQAWDDDVVIPEGYSSNKSNTFRFLHWMKRSSHSKTSRTRLKIHTKNRYNPQEYKSPNEMELSSSKPNANRTPNQLPINTLETTTQIVVTQQVQETTNVDHFPIEMYVIEYPQQIPSQHSFNTEAIV